MAPSSKVERDEGANHIADLMEFLTKRIQYMTDRDPLLQEREKTHGSFSNNARMWDRFCKAINNEAQFKPEQRLALCMIFLKIARLHEQPLVKDHWDDIAGYAKLGSEACE